MCQLKHDCSHSELLKIVAGRKSHYWIEKSLLVVSYLDSQEGTAVYWPKYWCGNIFINIWDMSMIFSKWQTPLVKSLCYFDIKFCDSILSKLFGNFSKLFSIPFQAQSRTYHLELKLQSFAKKSATFSVTRWQDYFHSIWQVAKIKICQITYKICQNTWEKCQTFKNSPKRRKIVEYGHTESTKLIN